MLLKTTKLEKTEKITKSQKMQNPPWEDGELARKSLLKLAFLLLDYNALAEMPFGPCYLGSKGLQNISKRSPAKGEASWKL